MPMRVRVDDTPLGYLLWIINRSYCRVFHHFAWGGPDPLPRDGPGILVCNHRSSVDPFILSATTRRIISFLIAEEYYRIPLFRTLFRWMGCIPVKRNQRDTAAVRKALKALEEGRMLCIFPEGGIKRGVENSSLGVGYLCLRSGVPVIPAYVEGTPEAASVWRSLLRHSHSTVRFGNACRPPLRSNSRLDRAHISATTAKIMAAVVALSP